MNDLEFSMDNPNAGAGGLNFLNGWQKDNVVCIQSGNATQSESNSMNFSQTVIFGCGYFNK